MYCKKCGTERNGMQKFCPKCGKPFLSENGKPYLMGRKRFVQNVKDSLFSKIDKLYQYGKVFLKERLLPILQVWIHKIKSFDWNVIQSNSTIYDLFSKPLKVKLMVKALTIIFVVCFFVIIGFSVSFWWYVLMGVILLFAFTEPKVIKKDSIVSNYMNIGVCLVLMLIAVINLPPTKEGRSLFFFNNATKEICITLKSDVSRGYGTDVSGNYGIVCGNGGYFTGVITVPQGKMWIFKKQEIVYPNPNEGSTTFHPDILYYNTGNIEARPIVYNCYLHARNIPTFRGNDQFRIRVRHSFNGMGFKAKSIDAKVFFVEKDDDLEY